MRSFVAKPPAALQRSIIVLPDRLVQRTLTATAAVHRLSTTPTSDISASRRSSMATAVRICQAPWARLRADGEAVATDLLAELEAPARRSAAGMFAGHGAWCVRKASVLVHIACRAQRRASMAKPWEDRQTSHSAETECEKSVTSREP